MMKKNTFQIGAMLLLCLGSLTSAIQAQETPSAASTAPEPRTLGVVLYPGFEVLDVMGPVEMFLNLGPQNIRVIMIAEEAGLVAAGSVLDRGQYAGPKVLAEYGFADAPAVDILLVPGGAGTFPELGNEAYLEFLRKQSETTELTTSVCSGSALLAKAGLLDGVQATCNKAYYTMLTGPNGPNVNWVPRARWVEDGKFITSSGVSAGIDMALAVIARLYGEATAKQIANATEYVWNSDPENDPFAKTFAAQMPASTE